MNAGLAHADGQRCEPVDLEAALLRLTFKLHLARYSTEVAT